jgi:glycosyltransferase involved in cell wall biosynthesis
MLARALDDILAQTFAAWQIVVVNDGGNPAEVERILASRGSELGERVLALHADAPSGRPAAANRGFDNVSGDYVVLHDDDDLWHPDFLRRTADYLDATPDAVAVTVPTEFVTEQAQGDDFIDVGRRPFNPPGEVVTLFDLILINRIVPISMLIRGSVLKEIGGWDEALKCVGDWEFNLRLATRGQIGYLRGQTLAFWMHRPDLTQGSLANSMYGSTDGHFEFDRLVRDRALLPGDTHHQIGQLLYLSKFIDEQLHAAENRIVDRLRMRIGHVQDELRRDVEYYSLGATARRNLRRMMRRR